MSEAKVVFTLDGIDLVIQCLISDKMRDICQRFGIKAEKNINSLIFLYGGNMINLDLTFESQANSIDRVNKIMKVLVYKNENDEYICPNCGYKSKLNIKEIISSYNNIIDNIDGIKLNIENIINTSLVNTVNNQLKNINILLNTIKDEIKKNNKKVENIINMNNNINNKNIIKATLDIKVNKNIKLFSTNINNGIDVYLNSQKINMIKNKNEWIINYTFKNNGKYIFDIIFNNNINNMKGFFIGCSNIISLDVSNFNTSNVTDMSYMFNECKNLKEIKGINKFNTNKVTNMRTMFQSCNVLEYLDLSNFNTSNVVDMTYMFSKCNKLKEIKGINKFNINKVTNMSAMFQACNALEYLDLSNFNTSNVTDMSYMFAACNKLKEIKGINKFETNKVINMSTMFQDCNVLEYLDLSNFNTSNVTDMSYMFFGCNKLKYLNLLNFTNNCETKNMFCGIKKKKCEFNTNNQVLLKLYNSS